MLLATREHQTGTVMNKLAYRLAAVLVTAALTACSSTPSEPATHVDDQIDRIAALLENRFGPRPDIISPEDLHALTPTQVADFNKFLRRPSIQTLEAHEQVAKYLNRVTEAFAYDEKTQPAHESLSTASGNCMSLAVLTTALAELADVEIGYQLVNSSPVFQWEGDLILKGQHLRSVLFRASVEPGTFTLLRSSIRIDYFPGGGSRYVRRVERPEYFSMYYNNLAADALADLDYNRAWWLLQESLQQQPDNLDALNVLALMYRRSGDADHAEKLFKAIIHENPEAVVILRNYRALLRSLDRTAEALEITRQLADLEDAHPVDWLQAGDAEFRDNNYAEAIRYFNKAAELAPYMHEAYLGLAQAYYALDKPRQTRRQLELAIENAHRSSTRSLYQAKLGALAKSNQPP